MLDVVAMKKMPRMALQAVRDGDAGRGVTIMEEYMDIVQQELSDLTQIEGNELAHALIVHTSLSSIDDLAVEEILQISED